MNTATPVDLVRLRDDIQRGYDALVRERFGVLTPRQQQRLNEIILPIQKVREAVDEYRVSLDAPAALGLADPRYRLMYAIRTAMEMVLQCAYFLHINHMRKHEVMNHDQIEAVWLMERSGRRLLLEVERLWTQMRSEQSTARV